MKCYYEELGVERDADNKDIKTAYRKLALQLHPDKNPDPEAKEHFQVLQQAYEVLSDPQERAFYDKHREQILRGKNSDYSDNCLDVFQYFTNSCYKGYGDDEQGFYSVYREVFRKIAAEDVDFMDDPTDVERIPEFGNSTSSYEDFVAPFYAHFQSYCTKKTFTWLSNWNLEEAKDRRVLRAIEKETKKIQTKAKRERNEEVRSLVSFVRKRDKRVQAYNRYLEGKIKANRQKQENNRREQLLRRQRELAEAAQSKATFNEGYEEQLKQLEQEYSNESDDSGTEDEDYNLTVESEEADEDEFLKGFFCVACTKSFRNERAFVNHALSKKHRENEERLKAEMLAEEVSFQSICSNDDRSSSPERTQGKQEEQESAVNRKNKKGKKAKKKNPHLVSTGDVDDFDNLNSLQLHVEDSDEDIDWNSSGKKCARKNQNKKQAKPVDVMPKENSNGSQATISFVDEDEVSSHKCATCNASFESKNKLFAHLKKTNHSVYLPKSNIEASANATDVRQKKTKTKRK